MDLLEPFMEPKILLAMLLVASIQLLAYLGSRAKPQEQRRAGRKLLPR
jgi:hypothetical protein